MSLFTFVIKPKDNQELKKRKKKKDYIQQTNTGYTFGFL